MLRKFVFRTDLVLFRAMRQAVRFEMGKTVSNEVPGHSSTTCQLSMLFIILLRDFPFLRLAPRLVGFNWLATLARRNTPHKAPEDWRTPRRFARYRSRRSRREEALIFAYPLEKFEPRHLVSYNPNGIPSSSPQVAQSARPARTEATLGTRPFIFIYPERVESGVLPKRRERARTARRPGSQRVATANILRICHTLLRLEPLRPGTGRGPHIWATHSSPCARDPSVLQPALGVEDHLVRLTQGSSIRAGLADLATAGLNDIIPLGYRKPD